MAEDKAAKHQEHEETPEELAGLKPKKSKKKLIIIIAAIVLLLGGGGAGAYFGGFLGGKKTEATDDNHDDKAEAKPDKDGKAYFYDLGDMIVNLSGDGRRSVLLKLKMTLELEDEKDKTVIDGIKPRVLDNFQVYLRELRVDDLRGSAGMYRLREELLLRVAEAAHPAKIKDVLILEMLVQ